MPEQLPNIEPVAIALQTGRDETPRVDSRELAQRMGVKHKNTIELLDKHKADFLELGVLPFQTEKPSGPNGGRPERFALLNEDQAYLLLTYSRNTAKVRGLKVKLVQAFSAARKAAEQRKCDYLPTYHLAHDALKGLAPDRLRQQHLHMNVNKLLNKVAGLDAGPQDQLDGPGPLHRRSQRPRPVVHLVAPTPRQHAHPPLRLVLGPRFVFQRLS